MAPGPEAAPLFLYLQHDVSFLEGSIGMGKAVLLLIQKGRNVVYQVCNEHTGELGVADMAMGVQSSDKTLLRFP